MIKSKNSILMATCFVLLYSSNQTFGQTGIASCASIVDETERLVCYDRAAENVGDLPVVRIPRTARSAPQADVTEPLNTNVARQDEFGLELKREKQRESGPSSRIFTVLAAKHNDFTGWTIEFEGGGIWKQVGTDDYRVTVGETYTVQRASLNSFLLTNSRNNKKIRITRVE
jgi:hypothetical protein|tara:strand:- start:761 stop:1276 length:516 start_codon:yes stop_codon:yes gene_type:complete